MPKFGTDLVLFKNWSWFKVTHILNVLSLMFHLLRLLQVRNGDASIVDCACAWEFSITSRSLHPLKTHICEYPRSHKSQLKITDECYLETRLTVKRKFYSDISVGWAFLASCTLRRNWNSTSISFCSAIATKSWNVIILEDKDVLKNISIVLVILKCYGN